MQHIDAAYWSRAREVLTCERNLHAGSAPWSALRRLHADVARGQDPFHARALVELGLGLARPHVPCLDGAHVTDDGGIGGLAFDDGHAEEVVLGCVLGLLGTLEGTDGVQERLAALWPS